MLQQDLKEIEARILKSHNELLEYVNEIAVRVNTLADYIKIILERVQELENANQ